MKFTIKTPIGFVKRVDINHGCVVTADPLKARKWLTATSAQQFLDMWADAGFGLSSKTAEIVEITA